MPRPLAALALLLLACPSAVVRTPAPAMPSGPVRAPARTWAQPAPVVVRHARLYTSAGPVLDDGAVRFEGGRIVQVGKDADVTTPTGAEEVDAKGRTVTPGLIDVHSHLGVYPSPGSFASDEGNEASAPVTAEVDAAHSFWPQDPGLRRAAAGGITSLLVLPGSANLIGGRGFPVKLHFGRTADEVRFPGAKDSLKMACGENPRRVYGEGKKSAPMTRMGNLAGFRAAFAQAKEYQARWDEWRKKAEAEGDKAGLPPSRDLKLETLAAVLRGELLVQNHCYRADEMQLMIDVGHEFGFQVRAFHHALEAYKVRDLLAKEGVASATWADWYGFKLEAWDGIPWNAGLLASARARVVIHSDSSDGIQRLNQEAAKALFHARQQGLALTEEEALKWITLDAAWVMGVEKVTGSLEVGKMADLVLWDRDPLSAYARAQRVWADGVVTYSAETGPADPSDFEVGPMQEWARLRPPGPGALPALPKAARVPRPLLPVVSEACQRLEGATLVEGGVPRVATVEVRDGRVAAVGPALAAGPGCARLDATGLVLTPGLIDPGSSLGLVEVELEPSTVDADTGRAQRSPERLPVQAAVRAADSLNLASAHLAVTRQGGVTATVSQPWGGLVSGQAAAVATDGTVLAAQAALVVNLGSAGGGALGLPRGAAAQAVRELFDDARAWQQRRADFEQNRLRALATGPRQLEALGPYLDGKLPVVFRADRLGDVRAAVQLIREYRLKGLVSGGAEAWQAARELAEARVPVVIEATADLPSSFDALATRPDAARLLAAAGVKVLLRAEGPDRLRALNQQAANAVAWGLPWAAALDAITVNVAEAYGLPGGKVAPGGRADLVLWDGDPLDLASRPVAVWVAGRQQPLQSRQDALLEKYRTVP